MTPAVDLQLSVLYGIAVDTVIECLLMAVALELQWQDRTLIHR